MIIDNRVSEGLERNNVKWIYYSKSYHIAKRAFDLSVSTLALVFYLPIFLLLSILVKLTSSGPAIMIFPRVGQYGRTLHVFKFRTFLIDPKYPEDAPTYTSLGKFLRKVGLQELPMLINVFLGNMSLVGPRPLLVRELEFLNNETIQRLSVKPGITGLAQISRDYDKDLVIDVEYVKTASFLLDLKILWKAVLVILNQPSQCRHRQSS